MKKKGIKKSTVLKGNTDRQELLDKLNLAKECLAKRDIIPILCSYCFYPEHIVSFDDTAAMIIEHKNDLNCAVSGEELRKLIERYSAERINVEKIGEKVVITSGKSKIKLNTIGAEEFLFNSPDLEGTEELDVCEDMIKGIKLSLISAGEDVTEVSEYGITLEKEDDIISICSSNNEAISRFMYEVKDKGTHQVLLPSNFCEKLCMLFDKFGDGVLSISEDFVQADFMDEKEISISLNSKIISEVEFLPFDEMIEKFDAEDNEYFELPGKLSDIVERGMILTRKLIDKVIKISIDEGVINFEVDTDLGKMKDEIEVEGAIETIECNMDLELLKEAIKGIDEFTFTTVEDHTVFIGQAENFIHIVESYEVKEEE